MNIKTIFVSTTLSILFGIYSIYGLINYLEKMDKLEKYYKDEIQYLKKQIYKFAKIGLKEKINLFKSL